MTHREDILKGFTTPESRWAKIGPFYAMFPMDFTFDVIERFSKPDEGIIDPFAGRCSTVFAGGVLGRKCLGIEINPVGWLYGIVKISPAEKTGVVDRLDYLVSVMNDYRPNIVKMPPFYRMCYCDDVLTFLLAARANLDWQNTKTDATLMTLILVYLHGKLGEGLSNQMKMTKAMGMQYSIRWWKSNKLINPPVINPRDFLIKKIQWRYEKGQPDIQGCNIILGDSTVKLHNVVEDAQSSGKKYSLLFTSPPYYSVTDYYADQWLRLWMLGDPEIPTSKHDKNKRRFSSTIDYYNLLDTVFGNCSKIMEKHSVVYVRTDKREFTFNTTLEVLKKYFPHHKLSITESPYHKRTQTVIHGNRSTVSGEMDIILSH